MSDGPILRAFQERVVVALKLLLAKIAVIYASGCEPAPEDKTLILDAAPGSGKTPVWLHCAVILFRLGLIVAVVCYVPRIILARQTERTWAELRKLYAAQVMGPIEYRDNRLPFIAPGSEAFGFIATLQSLCTQPDAHIDFFKTHRVLLIGDEGQFLGLDADGNGTQSAEHFSVLAELSFATIIMSGTPIRADNAPLLFARYSLPDEHGVRYLLPDVQASYLEGVRDGYLRPIEAQLHDGIARYEYADGGDEEKTVSEMERGLSRIMVDERFYVPLLEATIEKISERQRVWKPYCGLIGCVDQDHARAVLAFVRKNHPNVRALLAISDDHEAQANLEKFKGGG